MWPGVHLPDFGIHTALYLCALAGSAGDVRVAASLVEGESCKGFALDPNPDRTGVSSQRGKPQTILCPDSAELQPGWLDVLLKQQKQGVVDLRHEASVSSNTSSPSSEHYR